MHIANLEKFNFQIVIIIRYKKLFTLTSVIEDHIVRVSALK